MNDFIIEVAKAFLIIALGYGLGWLLVIRAKGRNENK